MKFQIRYVLIFINSMLIVITASVIISFYSEGTKFSVYSISDNLMKEIIGSVVNKTELYLKPAEKANMDIAFHYWNNDKLNFISNDELALQYFKVILSANQEFVMVYFADHKGNLIMGRRMPDGSLTKRYVYHEDKGIRIHFEHENQYYNPIYPDSFDTFENGYDPRNRPWYKIALEKKSIYWTDVYIFATDKMPGFSCAMPIYKNGGELIGISCIDIGIKDLSLFLGNISLTKNAKLFILDASNQIIAMPLNKNESLDKIFSISSSNGTEERKLYTIENFPDKIASSSYKNYLKQSDKSHPFSFKEKGNLYFSMFSSLQSDRGLNLKIGIVIPDKDIMGTVYRNNIIILGISIIFILIVMLISSYLARLISNPMYELSLEMNKIKDFSIDDKGVIKPTIIREVDNMVESFEGMKKGLLNFKKFVPSELVIQLIKNQKEAIIGGENKLLTVMFTDIANFTTISEQIPPSELVVQLCDYFSVISKTILDKKGTLDKYIGDAAMAFWGAPNNLENHAALACESALLCKSEIYNLSHKWESEGKPKFPTRLGINTGEVIVGNMGYEKRMNYTVIGDNVNIASRLEGANKFYGTEILISESTYNLVKDGFECRLIDKVAVKGKTKGMFIYELISHKNRINKNFLKLIELYGKGFDFYISGKWNNAVKYFDLILKHYNDNPTKVLKERCLRFIENAPKDWQEGVFILRSK